MGTETITSVGFEEMMNISSTGIAGSCPIKAASRGTSDSRRRRRSITLREMSNGSRKRREQSVSRNSATDETVDRNMAGDRLSDFNEKNIRVELEHDSLPAHSADLHRYKSHGLVIGGEMLPSCSC